MANNGDMLVSDAQWFLRERGLELSQPTIRARIADGTLKAGSSTDPMTITRRSLEKMGSDPDGYRRRFRPGRKSRQTTAA